MRHGSLFSGIGGFDLAAQWAGWENVFNCEIDEWEKKILKNHFPKAKQFSNVTTFNGNDWNGEVDIITGGFPCQPYSSAGNQDGSWGKTFSVCLLGTVERCLRRLPMTWKRRDTRFGRSLFQHVVSEPITSGSDCGLLPTPTKGTSQRQ